MVYPTYWLDKKFKVLTATNEIVSSRSDQMVDPHGEQDINSAEGWANLNTIRLEPRVMEVLKLLIEANGKMVSRKFLMEEVWNNYEGGEEGMNQAISKLRKAFQENARDAKIIQTISKKGYRITATIEQEMSEGHLMRFTPETSSSKKSVRPQIIVVIEYLREPRNLLVFVIVSSVAIAVLYLMYKILYAWVWS